MTYNLSTAIFDTQEQKNVRRNNRITPHSAPNCTGRRWPVIIYTDRGYWKGLQKTFTGP